MTNLIYISGLSGSGKTTIGKELQKHIVGSVLLDGDIIRNTINTDLGFTPKDKIENIRRNNALISMLHDQGITVICCFMASIPEERNKLFDKFPGAIKVQLSTTLDVCQTRNVKGLYSTLPDNFAGVTAIYCPLPNPDITIDTTSTALSDIVDTIMRFVNCYATKDSVACSLP